MKKHGWTYCLLAWLLAGSWVLAGCSDQPGTVKGTVTKASGGTPLLGAEVRVFSLDRVEGTSSDMPVFAKGPMIQCQPTGEDGTFSFSLEPGEYIIGVWLEGGELVSRRVEVKGRRTATIDLSADAPGP